MTEVHAGMLMSLFMIYVTIKRLSAPDNFKNEVHIQKLEMYLFLLSRDTCDSAMQRLSCMHS